MTINATQRLPKDEIMRMGASFEVAMETIKKWGELKEPKGGRVEIRHIGERVISSKRRHRDRHNPSKYKHSESREIFATEPEVTMTITLPYEKYEYMSLGAGNTLFIKPKTEALPSNEDVERTIGLVQKRDAVLAELLEGTKLGQQPAKAAQLIESVHLHEGDHCSIRLLENGQVAVSFTVGLKGLEQAAKVCRAELDKQKRDFF